MRAIITYHSVDPSGSVISIDPGSFRRHVEWMASSEVQVLGVTELLRQPPNGPDALAVTFDDGFTNFVTEAWPVLREHDIRVTVFVATDRVGGTNDWNDTGSWSVPELPLLGWPELATLAEQGVTLGSHTRTHGDLRSMTGAELDYQVGGSAERIEAETGQRATLFAYPFGYYDDRVVSAVKDHFEAACTADLDLLPDRVDRHRLPRLDAYYYRRPGLLERFGAPAFERHVRVRSAARLVRRKLATLGGQG